ncbi:MAG TPA: DUF2911 domain-containing protein [Candidatus Udaeobacter sp.]|jgi:hypothetical protein|nr:DUF2911 domain-containing protein [Candidatus Udaeobacter sp.]
MRSARLIFALLFCAALTTPAAADESGAFVVRLGRDTTSVERYTRGPRHIEIDQVGRSPRVLRRHFAYDFAPSGAVTRLTMHAAPAGAAAGAPGTQDVTATFGADSVTMETRRDTSVTRQRFGAPAGAVVISNASPWSLYETQTAKLAGMKGDSVRAALWYLGGTSVSWMTVRRLGRDSMVIETGSNLYHARVDRAGRILNIVPIYGTADVNVDRQTSLDLDAMAAGFLAREQSGGAMGVLSPRDTVRATAGGAALWIDYGRPSKRGRTVYGGMIPWGQVWRTGANAATQFRTDHALVMGGTTVPAGFYTLWTIPSPTGWKLVINGETGQWGTEHKAERDLYTIAMPVQTLPQPVERFTIGVESAGDGGALNFDWDTTRASVAFTVKP